MPVIIGIDGFSLCHMYSELKPKNIDTGNVTARAVINVGLKPIGPYKNLPLHGK
jgi:hypothetical protein